MSENELPPGWIRTTIGEVCRVVGGATPDTKNPDYWGGDVAWVTPADLSDYTGTRIAAGARNLTQAGFDSCSAQMLPPGTVLFSSRAPIGHIAIADAPLCTNQGFKSVVPPPGVLPEYLYWYLRYITPVIRRMGSGTTFAEVSGKVMKQAPLLLCPTEEQQRIVEELARRLSHHDAAIRALQAGAARVGQVRAALVQAALAGQLSAKEAKDGEDWKSLVTRVAGDRWQRGRWRAAEASPAIEVPVGWSQASLGELSWDAGYGTSTKCHTDPYGVPVVRIPNVRTRRVDLMDLKYAPTSEIADDLRLEAHDLLFIRSNGSRDLIGLAALAGPAAGMSFASYLIRFRLAPDDLLAEWVELVASAPSSRRLLVSRASSSAGQYNLGLTDLADLPVPLPPRSEMAAILTEFARRTSLVDAAGRTVRENQQKAARLRRALLRAAFTGRLVSQEADAGYVQGILDQAEEPATSRSPKRRQRDHKENKA
jgi:type I restriction enzyme, S subunit